MDFRYYTTKEESKELQKYLNAFTANISIYGDNCVDQIPYMLNSRAYNVNSISEDGTPIYSKNEPGWTITCLLDQILPDAITINDKTYWLNFEKDGTWEISYRTADNKLELVSFKQEVNEPMITPVVSMTKWCGERDYIPDLFKFTNEQTYQ